MTGPGLRKAERPAAAAVCGRVAMLVTNPCINDSRVIRAAETVAAQGFEVIVLATSAPGVPDLEEKNGVLYRRLRATPPLQSVSSSPSATRPGLSPAPAGCSEVTPPSPGAPVVTASVLPAASAATSERPKNVPPPATPERKADARGKGDLLGRLFRKILRRVQTDLRDDPSADQRDFVKLLRRLQRLLLLVRRRARGVRPPWLSSSRRSRPKVPARHQDPRHARRTRAAPPSRHRRSDRARRAPLQAGARRARAGCHPRPRFRHAARSRPRGPTLRGALHLRLP